MMEATVSKWSAEAFVEEQEQQGNLNAFGGLDGRRSVNRHVRVDRGL